VKSEVGGVCGSEAQDQDIPSPAEPDHFPKCKPLWSNSHDQLCTISMFIIVELHGNSYMKFIPALYNESLTRTRHIGIATSRYMDWLVLY
jgi:hypothetical protein